jgi:predicted esterase
MKKLYLNLIILSISILFSACASQNQQIINKHCKPADNITYASGNNQCLKIITKNNIKNPKALVIFIHGDVSKGGASDYFNKRVYQIEPKFNDIVAITLIRPGYYDSNNNYSSGGGYTPRRDSYTKENITIIAQAIKNIKNYYKPNKLILVGHSGGANIVANIIGLYPSLVNGAVIGACPCDVFKWRAMKGKSNWNNSLSPINYVNTIKDTKVILVAGKNDSNVKPKIMIKYYNKLKQQNIDAKLLILDDISHNGVARSSEFYDAILDLVH